MEKLNLYKFSISSDDEPVTGGVTTTTNIRLEKPSATDKYNINVQNNNMDKIDAAIKALQDRVTELENNALTFVKTGEF